MKKIIIFLLLISIVVGQDIVTIGSLPLTSGKQIESCQIGYQKIGRVNQDSSNIVLYPTWFGGTSRHIISLIQQYNLIDTTKYLTIAVDALGNGISTSPSNYPEALPKFSIHDMVVSQYQLLTEKLGVKKLYAIVGGSMGSFQAFEWLISYPDFAQKAIPYVASPVRTASDKLWLSLEMELIALKKKYKIPEGDIEKILGMFTEYIARTQNYLTETVDTDEFHDYYQKFQAKPAERFTLMNRKSQVEAMMTHDITRHYEHSLEKAAANIEAELLIIVSDTDQIVNPKPALTLANYLNAETLIFSNECGHLAPSCDMKTFKKAIQQFLSK